MSYLNDYTEQTNTRSHENTRSTHIFDTSNNLSVEECALRCTNLNCLSFEHKPSNGTCNLLDIIPENTKALSDYNLYSRKSTDINTSKDMSNLLCQDNTRIFDKMTEYLNEFSGKRPKNLFNDKYKIKNYYNVVDLNNNLEVNNFFLECLCSCKNDINCNNATIRKKRNLYT